MKIFLIFLIFSIFTSFAHPKAAVEKCVEFEPSKYEKINEAMKGKWHVVRKYISESSQSDASEKMEKLYKCMTFEISATDDQEKMNVNVVIGGSDGKPALNGSFVAKVEKPGVLVIEKDIERQTKDGDKKMVHVKEKRIIVDMDENCIFTVSCAESDGNLFQKSCISCRDKTLSEKVAKNADEILEKHGMAKVSVDLSHENCKN